METNGLKELAIIFCSLIIIFMLIISTLIPFLVYKINFSPNAYFLKNQTCKILKTYFSNELSDVLLACAYRSKFFYLKGMVTIFLGTFLFNWIFALIYLFIFWSYSDNYVVFICNLCVLIFVIFFNILNFLTFLLLWNLVKKWRRKYHTESWNVKLINSFNDVNLSKINIYNLLDKEDLKVKKYLLWPFYYLLNQTEKLNKIKTISNKKINEKIFTIFYKMIFLLTRNIKWMEFINIEFCLYKFKLNENDNLYPIFELLKFINQILIILPSATISENPKDFLNNYVGKIFS